MSIIWKLFCETLFKNVASDLPSTLNRAVAGKGLLTPAQPLNACNAQQTRGRYLDWRMWRDVKRRRMVSQFADEKLRINAIRKNNIIPKAIQELADREIHELPRDAHHSRLVHRCVLTSKPRSTVYRHRIGRIQWRKLADYNKLSGVTRAWW